MLLLLTSAGYGHGVRSSAPPQPHHQQYLPHATIDAMRKVSPFSLLLHPPRPFPLAHPSLPSVAAPLLPHLHATSHKSLSFFSSPPDHDQLPTSAYVHLPFCKRRCFYCDFAIVAVGERNGGSAAHMDSMMEGYVDSVCTEIDATFTRWSSEQVRPLQTLFFGGGTPSLLPAKQLERIVKRLENHCGFAGNIEVSMEMDPGTFTAASLSQYLDCGVNRISLGVQVFHEALLKACGRSHGLQDVYEAIHVIEESGVRNWSLDLISSLPHQTISDWEETLQRAIDAAPAHVSVYDLQIEDGTKFGAWYKTGQHPLPDDESSAAFYRTASALLKGAGYEHYEISNYAKPGYQCRHNLVYWKNLPYYAFGLGSTSYVQSFRFSRPKKWKAYADYVKNLDSASSHPLNVEELLGGANPEETTQDGDDRLLDTIMLSLRLASGLNLTSISQTFGNDIVARIIEAFLPFVLSGHAIALDANHQPLAPKQFSTLVGRPTAADVNRADVYCIRLSDPEGFLLSNEIISSLFSSLSRAN